MVGRIGGYVGTTLGFLGWLVGFTVFCFATGNTAPLAEFFYLGLAISLALALNVIVAGEAMLRLYPQDRSMFLVSLWGMLLLAMGVLLLLLNHWIAPIIERYPKMLADLQRVNFGRGPAVYRTSDTVPAVSLTLAVVLLAVTVVRLATDGMRSEAPAVPRPPELG